jgi:hypothetical protein
MRVTFALAMAATLLAPAVTHAAITINFDYTYDSSGFFSGANIGRRSILQAAGADVAAHLSQEHFAAVVPSGSNTWSLDFTNPSTGGITSLPNPVVTADTMTIYVGAMNLGGAAGIGGGFGFGASGDGAWINFLQSKLQSTTRYESMGGAISFDTSTTFYFDSDPSTLESFTGTDFYSVAEHEIGHVLGFASDIDAFAAHISGGTFVGTHAQALYGGPVPLSPDHSHWQQGVISPGDNQEVAMDPTILNGTRKRLSNLDYAAFQDIGLTIVPEPATLATAAIAGTALLLRRRTMRRLS